MVGDGVIGVPWNMAQIYYFELAKLLRYKDAAYLSSDFKGYRASLKAIYRRIYFKLSKKEREEFVNYFNEVDNLAKLGNQSDVGKEIITERMIFKLDNIDTLIVEKMDKYGMIFPDVEIKGLEQYEKKMRL